MTDAITDPFKTTNENYLETLVGDGKKFATVEDLARGKKEADDFIETLKSENAALKNQSANGMNVDKLMEEIRKLNEGKSDPGNGQPKATEPQNPPTQNIEEIVLQTLNKVQSQSQASQNEQLVIEKVNEAWGNDANSKLKEIASGLGLSLEDLKEQGRKSPAAFFALTGLNADRSPKTGLTVPTGTVTPGKVTTGKRDWNYYQELKKSNPAVYKETRVQIQMNKDARELGEAFFPEN